MLGSGPCVLGVAVEVESDAVAELEAMDMAKAASATFVCSTMRPKYLMGSLFLGGRGKGESTLPERKTSEGGPPKTTLHTPLCGLSVLVEACHALSCSLFAWHGENPVCVGYARDRFRLGSWLWLGVGLRLSPVEVMQLLAAQLFPLPCTCWPIPEEGNSHSIDVRP